MQQGALLQSAESYAKVNWSTYARSLSFDEREIIEWIIRLHNGGNPFDVDPCYSTGRFWEGLPQPTHKFDIAVQTDGVRQADARALPMGDESVDSVMFDPPFVVAPSPKPGIIRDRFSCYRNITELWQFYQDALAEFYRILRPAGIVAFKCQDIVSSGRNWMTHAKVITQAEEIGYYTKDLFVLGRQNILWSPNMANQKHARKNHSYFIVLRKEQAVKP